MAQIRRESVVAAEDLVSCDLAGETALLQFTSGVYYGLNPVATFVWKLIQGPKTFEDLRDAVLTEYDVEPEECERDLRALIEELSAAHLIEVRGTSPA
jgi:hypothetical protein